MKTDDHHEAFKFLLSQSLPAEEKIATMSTAEIDAFLTEQGMNVTDLNQRIAQKKKLMAGRHALMLARQRRLATQPKSAPSIAVPSTNEEILKVLKSKYGEELPLAARKCREMSYEELSQLFLDLMGDSPSAADGK